LWSVYPSVTPGASRQFNWRIPCLSPLPQTFVALSLEPPFSVFRHAGHPVSACYTWLIPIKRVLFLSQSALRSGMLRLVRMFICLLFCCLLPYPQPITLSPFPGPPFDCLFWHVLLSTTAHIRNLDFPQLGLAELHLCDEVLSPSGFSLGRCFLRKVLPPSPSAPRSF